jgi:hypothetical protein
VEHAGRVLTLLRTGTVGQSFGAQLDERCEVTFRGMLPRYADSLWKTIRGILYAVSSKPCMRFWLNTLTSNHQQKRYCRCMLLNCKCKLDAAARWLSRLKVQVRWKLKTCLAAAAR